MRLFVPGSAARLTVIVALISALTGSAALAVDQVHDEIQVYNASIAEVGQWSYEQHLNFAAIGQTVPDFPADSRRTIACKARLEFAYGLTKWWEVGFYLPFAVKLDVGANFGLNSVTPTIQVYAGLSQAILRLVIVPDLPPLAGRDFLLPLHLRMARCHTGTVYFKINDSENLTRQCGVQTFWKQKTSVNCFGRQSPMHEDRAPGQKKLVSTALLSISFCVGGNSQLNRSYVPSSCESCTWRKNLRCLQVEGRYHGLIRSLTATQGSDFRSGSFTTDAFSTRADQCPLLLP